MVYLNIGSNLGQAEQNLRKALEAIEEEFGQPLSVSKPYYSLPWGYISGNSYTNIGVAFDISVEDSIEASEALLQRLLDIQFGICPQTHRDASGGYTDRLIDIDLIAIDERVIDSPTLTLPHPRMHLRDFVLVPMAELAPGWRHPIFHLTCSEMLANLNEKPPTHLQPKLQDEGNEDQGQDEDQNKDTDED